MIDFNTDTIFKLSPAKNSEGEKLVNAMLTDNETVLQTFKTIRDTVVFTNKRIISISIQGVTGKKKDFTSLPYSKIQVFSVETSGVLDLDCDLEVWFSCVGRIRFEFSGAFDIKTFNQVISSYIL